MKETRVRSLGWEDPLEEEMATHSSTLGWENPWTKEPSDYAEDLSSSEMLVYVLLRQTEKVTAKNTLKNSSLKISRCIIFENSTVINLHL